MHDGSGFYNPVHIDKQENPHRWGQSVVIDQSSIDARRFGNLETVALNAIAATDKNEFSRKERFQLKNTETRLGDVEMEKTLTYFAIRYGKPAMGVEASKSYPTERRIFNHLRFVEAMMDQMGIESNRRFSLSAEAIKYKLGRDIQLAIYDNKILYDFDTARSRINYVPLKKKSNIKFSTNNPLVAIVNSSKGYSVRYGNRGVTTLSPEYFNYDDSLHEIEMEIDGVNTLIPIGSQVVVRKNFVIKPIAGRRVNVIGFSKAGVRNESGLLIGVDQISRKYSVDKQANKFRVEFYRNKEYSGMILIDISGQSPIKTVLKKPSQPLGS